MRQDYSGWSGSIEHGETLCSFQGSPYRSPKRASQCRRMLPILPVSPIKSADILTRSNRQSTRTDSYTGILENHKPAQEITNNPSPMRHYERFRRRLDQEFRDSSSVDSEENFQGKEIYDEVIQLRELVEKRKNPPRRGRNVTCSTYMPPAASFAVEKSPYMDFDSTIEAPRNKPTSLQTSPIRTKTSDIVEELLDINLNSLKEIGVGDYRLRKENYSSNNAFRPTNPPRVPRLFSGRELPGSLDPSSEFRRERLSYSPTQRTATSNKDRAFSDDSRVPKVDIRQVVRGCFSDVDAIRHKGGVDLHKRQMDSTNICRVLGGSTRARSYSVPRRQIQSDNSSINSKPPSMKQPPFLSSNNGYLSQAIHANEQEVIRLVNTYFPQWRNFVHLLLKDPKIGNDVAIRFLEEIVNRRRSKEFQLIQGDDNEYVYEFNAKDEKLANKLRDLLCRGHPSRIRQLRILQQVLKEFC